jgi:hypothetical protein
VSSHRFAVLFLTLLVAGVALLGVTQAALGYSGGVHQVATQRAVDVMQVWDHMEAITASDAFAQYRFRAKVRMFPELTNNDAAMSYLLVNAAWNYDEYVGDMGTRNHFWTCDDDLDECPEGIVGVDNAWEVARREWLNAVIYHRNGDLVSAYFHLGAVMHLVEDMAQPAHTNSDLHGPTNRDSLEEWGGYAIAEPWYSWTDPNKTWPGTVFTPPSKKAIIQRVIDRQSWDGRDEFLVDKLLSSPSDPFNTAQLFWIMYVTNQWANYFASDGESGNKTVRLGWVDYEALGFPKHLHRYGQLVSAQSESALDDNEGPCSVPGCGDEFCNCDRDLSVLAKWGYRAATRGAGGVLALFRRTVDHTPPVTQVTITRNDGKTFVADGWNNSPVTVRLHDAVDPDSPGFQDATGVWTVYGLVNGEVWAPNLAFPITQLQKTFASSGTNTVKVRTTDNAGNIELKSHAVKVDVTPPLVGFPGWQDWYLTCQQPKATWTASDVPSGLRLVTGTLDGKSVVKNKLIDRALLTAAPHTLTVNAKDWAGNRTIADYMFRVLPEFGLVVGKPTALRGGTTTTYKIVGALEPQHYLGSAAVTVVIQKKRDGEWATWQKLAGKAGADKTYSCYARMVKGTFRVRAEHYHPTLVSQWTKFKVE